MDDGLRQIAGIKGRRVTLPDIVHVRLDEVDTFVVLRRPDADVALTPAQATRLASDLLHLATRVADRRTSEPTAKE